MTRSQLSRVVATKLKLDRTIVKAVVETVFEEIALRYVTGEAVKITNFGKFWVRTQPARRRFNFGDREIVASGPQRQARFTPCLQLQADVRGEGVKPRKELRDSTRRASDNGGSQYGSQSNQE